GRRGLRPLPLRAAADRRGGGRGGLHALRDPLHAARDRDGRAGHRGRVRRPHLRAGQGAAALLGPAGVRSPSQRRDGSRKSTVGSWGSKMTRIAVFAYSDTGYECLKFLFERGKNVALVVTHADDPKEERWFSSVAELSRSHGVEPLVLDDPREPWAAAK